MLLCLILGWMVALLGPVLRPSPGSALVMARAICSTRLTADDPAPGDRTPVAALPATGRSVPASSSDGHPGHGGLDCALCLVQVLAAPPPVVAGLSQLAGEHAAPSGTPPSPWLIPLRGLPMARAPPPVL